MFLDRREADAVAAAGASTEDSGASEPASVLRSKRRPRIVDFKKYPKEMRIRVVAGEIVNFPVADSGSAGTSAPGGFGPVKDAGTVDLTLHAATRG